MVQPRIQRNSKLSGNHAKLLILLIILGAALVVVIPDTFGIYNYSYTLQANTAVPTKNETTHLLPRETITGSSSPAEASIHTLVETDTGSVTTGPEANTAVASSSSTNHLDSQQDEKKIVEPLKTTTTQTQQQQNSKQNNFPLEGTSSSPHHQASSSMLFWTFPVANTTMVHTSRRSIVLLSMGKYAAKSTLVERILMSIRKRGQFLGPVILLTDCSPTRYQNLTTMDPNFVLWKPLEKDWNWNLPKDLPYKRFKTLLMDYLHRDQRLPFVEFLYYLDIDVVVGRPLQEWFDHVETTHFHSNNDHNNNNSKIAFFKGNYDNIPIQSGQIVMQRHSSEACLQGWRQHMDAMPTELKDQISLKAYSDEQKDPSSNQVQCQLQIMNQKPHLTFLDTQAMRQTLQKATNSTATSTQSDHTTTLMHIKNSQMEPPPDKLQRRFYQWLLDLTPAQAQLMGKVRIRPSRNWSANSTNTSIPVAR